MNPEEIKQARLKLMMNQADLGAALGVSRPAVILWEQGKREMPGPAAKLLKLYVKYPGLLAEAL